jgi:hypothetical protein
MHLSARKHASHSLGFECHDTATTEQRVHPNFRGSPYPWEVPASLYRLDQGTATHSGKHVYTFADRGHSAAVPRVSCQIPGVSRCIERAQGR